MIQMAQPVEDERRRPVTDPLVIRRQNQLFDLHRVWMADRVVADAPFEPDEWAADNSVYNLHYPDVEASPASQDEFHARAREIMGLPPLGQDP